MHYLLKNK